MRVVLDMPARIPGVELPLRIPMLFGMVELPKRASMRTRNVLEAMPGVKPRCEPSAPAEGFTWAEAEMARASEAAPTRLDMIILCLIMVILVKDRKFRVEIQK